MAALTNYDEWKKIQRRLCYYLQICSCQRKVKSLVDVLVRIWDNGHYREEDGCSPRRPWTDYEYLILAQLDQLQLITHGINCEYPIITTNEFWEWLLSIKDSPFLEDN